MKLYVAKDGSSWILYSPQYKVESIRLWSEPMYGDDADQRIKRCLDKVFKNGHWYDTTHTRIRMYEDCGMKPTRFYPQWGPGNVRIEYSDFRTKVVRYWKLFSFTTYLERHASSISLI